MMRTMLEEVRSGIERLDSWWNTNMLGPLSACVRFNERMQEERFASERWVDPVTTVYAVGQVRLRASQDHLLGAAYSLLLPSKHSALVLARASIEASAYAYWILDPDIRVQDRILRGAQLRSHDSLELRKLFRSLPTDDFISEQLTDIESRLTDTCEVVRGCGFPLDKGAKSLVGALPARTDLVSELLSSETLGGSPGEVVYRLLSGSVHSVLMALVISDPRGTFSHVGLDGVPEDEHPSSLLSVVLALNGLGLGLVRLAAVNGWSDPREILRPAVKAGLRALGIEETP